MVNESNKLLRVFYDAADLLRLPLGEANLDVISIVPSSLQLPLSTALHRAKREQQSVLYADIKLTESGKLRSINLKVGIEVNEAQRDKFLIVLLEEEELQTTTLPEQTLEVNAESINQLGELEYETPANP